MARTRTLDGVHVAFTPHDFIESTDIAGCRADSLYEASSKGYCYYESHPSGLPQDSIYLNHTIASLGYCVLAGVLGMAKSIITAAY